MPARVLGDLPPAAWLKNTGYVIDFEPLPYRVRAEVSGKTVLDSARVLVMYELGHAPVYYVPSGCRLTFESPKNLCTAWDFDRFRRYQALDSIH